MRRYFLRHALAMSFYSPDLYRDVGRNWTGIGLTYLLGVLLLCWLPSWIKMHVDVGTFFDEVYPAIVQQVPPIQFANGEAVVEGPQPCLIREPKSGQLIAFIDTTGAVPSLEAVSAPVLLTKTQLILHREDHSETRYELKTFDGTHIDRDLLYRWGKLFSSWYALFLYPAILGFSLAYHMIQVLTYAGFGFGASRLLGVRLGFGALMRLSAVAITPSLILGTVLEWAGLSLGWAPGFFLEMAYMLLAIRSNRDEPRPEEGVPTSGP
jgi:uncharacterized protein DUF1189